MSRCHRSLVYISAAFLCLLMLGFFVFASSATRIVTPPTQPADAIVVLTGGNEGRIEAGLKLLHKGLGKRMLISGVNRKLRPEEVLAHVAPEHHCCVDLGYDALDTIGNAEETSRWAASNHFTRLIVVTSSYHMPRSLNELSLAMPDAQLQPHPIRPRFFADGPWWLRPGAARILVSEYLKLLPSYARSTARRLVGIPSGKATSSTPPKAATAHAAQH